VPVSIRKKDRCLRIAEAVLKSKFQAQDKYPDEKNGNAVKGLVNQDQSKNSQGY